MDPAHTASRSIDPAHLGSAHPDTATTDRTHTDTTGTTDTAYESRPAPSPNPSAAFDFRFGLDANHTDATPMTDTAAIDVTPMERPHISETHGLDLDRTTPGTTGAHPPDDHPGVHPTPSAPADLRTSRSRSTMASEAPTGHVSDLDWLMSGLVQRVPHTNSAVLLSCDGLVKSVHGLDGDSADHMAALASGLYSLGRSAGVRFGDGGDVRQVVVELDSTLLFVTTAGSGTCLAVLMRPRGRRGGARLRDGDARQERASLPGDRAPPALRRIPGDEALSVAAALRRALARRRGRAAGAALHGQQRPHPAVHRVRPAVAREGHRGHPHRLPRPRARAGPRPVPRARLGRRDRRPSQAAAWWSPRCCCPTSSTAGR